jgi:hypothetical protein
MGSHSQLGTWLILLQNYSPMHCYQFHLDRYTHTNVNYISEKMWQDKTLNMISFLKRMKSASKTLKFVVVGKVCAKA